jgi:hypothetical protein
VNSVIFISADPAQAEADFNIYKRGRTLVSRTPGEACDEFEYRPDNADLAPKIPSFSVSHANPPYPPIYVIYAVFR